MDLSLELLILYVKESLKYGRPSSTHGHWEWCANITDPNYVYVQHIIFSYLHALMMFRASTRTCNAQVIFDGETKINKRFCDGKHLSKYNVSNLLP